MNQQQPPFSSATPPISLNTRPLTVTTQPPLQTSPQLNTNLNRRPVHQHNSPLSAMSRQVSSLVGNVLNDPAGEHAAATTLNIDPSIHSNSSSMFYPSPTPSPNYNEYGGVSRAEIWRMLANRIYFSKFYKFIYVSMTILALITIIMSFTNKCPTSTFLVLECIVNLTLIIEVAIRFFATRRQFWTSKANILDVVLVILCLTLLGMLLHDAQTCGSTGIIDDEQRTEALIDSILLIFRNGLQLARIFNMLRKNQSQLNTRVASVDFTALEDGNHADPLLFDADQQLDYGGGEQQTSLLPR